MLGLIRMVMVIMLFLNADRSDTLHLTILIAYTSLSLVLLFFSFISATISEKTVFHLFLISIDTAIITYFVFENSYSNQIYLLYLLPLITAAHFLSRNYSLGACIAILLFYCTAMVLVEYRIRGNITPVTFEDWFVRSMFLTISVFLYRIQRSLPSLNESKIVSPSQVIAELEKQLKEFNEIVPYDSISLQLLYRERFVIITCIGFQNKRHIHKIEFPAYDKNFPNYFVVKNNKTHITGVDNYPSFKDGAYHASHVKTWMGVPLISPSTHELIGLISIDSSKQNAYDKRDESKATWFAKKISLQLIEAALGPAALTQASRRDTIVEMTDIWKKQLVERVVKCTDDGQAARAITKIGREIFNVESCALFLRHPKIGTDLSDDVLYLVDSYPISKHYYEHLEYFVNNKPGVGLIGYAVHGDRTLNLSSSDIKKSPFHSTKHETHYKYLASGRIKQILIVPIRNFSKDPIGALVLENKEGVVSENRFLYLEQNLFELFTHSIGLILEGIRTRNYALRQRRNIHDFISVYKEGIARHVNDLVRDAPLNSETYEILKKSTSFVSDQMDNILIEPVNYFYLENDGLLSALEKYFRLLQDGMPNFRSRILYDYGGVAEVIPYDIKTALFNIGREAIMNALRHSKINLLDNGEIRVTFIKEDTEKTAYVLKISDNGVGFSVDEKRKTITSYGLVDMFENQQMILKKSGDKSKVTIDSRITYGTTVTATWAPGRN